MHLSIFTCQIWLENQFIKIFLCQKIVLYGIRCICGTKKLFCTLYLYQVKNDMVVLNLYKKLQEKWSHLTTQEKKLTDAKLVVKCCIWLKMAGTFIK